MAVAAAWTDDETDMSVIGAMPVEMCPWWREARYLADRTGVALTGWDPDEPEGTATRDYVVTWEQMRTAAQELAEGKHQVNETIRRDIARDDLDSEAADCVLQVCCYGRIVFS